MKLYSVTGSFFARRGDWQVFAKRVEAVGPEAARERALSHIGGCHGVPRTRIRIVSVEEFSA
jgi:ribosomal protein L20A (L18A)